VRPNRTTLTLYVVAAVVYVTIGVVNVDFLLSWPVAATYLLLVVWLIPAGARKIR
jgi:hypothetical protein